MVEIFIESKVLGLRSDRSLDRNCDDIKKLLGTAIIADRLAIFISININGEARNNCGKKRNGNIESYTCGDKKTI